MPDAANPDPGAANPGDRRCNTAKSGVRVRMKDGVAFPDPTPPSRRRPPAAVPRAPRPSRSSCSPCPAASPRPARRPRSTPARTTVAPGAHVVAYEWDMNGDGHVDTNTGTNPVAHVMTGAADLRR